jgi:protein-S-isoprenylcysteine O-methyltransferase Ste14
MTSADQPVITSGPYRFVRHPSYAGIVLVLTGIGITYGNWLSLAALALVPLIGFVYRIHVEEAALAATLGSRYTSYAAGRKRLIPFVW